MSGWPRRTSTSAYLCYERLPIGWRLMKALGDQFHESGGHGTGDWLADSSLRSIDDDWHHGKMAASVELAMTDEGDWKADGDFALTNRGGEPSGAAQMLLRYAEKPSFYAVGQNRVHIRRYSAASNGRWPMARCGSR